MSKPLYKFASKFNPGTGSNHETVTKLLCSLAAIASLLGFTPKAGAQTIQVNAGVNSAGYTVWMNVFEYDAVYEKPSFPGDLLEFINETRVYPPDAYKKGIQGKVQCWFIVNVDGSISNVELRPTRNNCKDPSLCEEAIRILKNMPRWIPGRDFDGVPVPVRVYETIKFRR